MGPDSQLTERPGGAIAGAKVMDMGELQRTSRVPLKMKQFAALLAMASLTAFLIITCGGNGARVERVPPATATVSNTALTPSATPEPSLLASGDLGKIAYDGIYTQALLDGNRQQPAAGKHPEWSPSGQWLLFLIPTGEQWVMRADGSQARKLDECGYASWATTEDLLTYWALDSNMTLVVERPDGSERREWSFPDGTIGERIWSPDGKWTAASETVQQGGQRSELWLVSSDSSSGPVVRPSPTPLPPPPTSVPLEERTGRVTLEVSASVSTDNPAVDSILTTDATVHVIGDGIDLTVAVGDNGRAEIKDIPVSSDPDRPTRVNVIITAPGYAPFSFKWVPLYPGSGPILTPALSDRPQVDDLSGPVPPIRPAPTIPPLLTPPAPPVGGIELYGTADEAVELRGWSGDSKYVLFQLTPTNRAPTATPEPTSLWSVSIADGRRRELPSTIGDWQALRGTSLIAMTASTSSNMWTGQRIVVVDVATGETAYLTDGDTASMSPSWSPDGTRIAYVSQPDRGEATANTDEEFAQAVAGRHIWLVNRDGSGKRQLTDDPRYRDEYPLWSKDGLMILFTRVTDDGSVSLWLMSADGGDQREVTAIDTSNAPSLWRYQGGTGWGYLFDWWQGSP